MTCAALAALSLGTASLAWAKAGDQTTEGLISSRTASGITVAGNTFTFGSGAECYRLLSRISCASLAVGDNVEVKWQGERVIREVEARNASSSSPSPSPSPSSTPRPSPTIDDHGGRSNSGKITRTRSAKLFAMATAGLGAGKAQFVQAGDNRQLNVNVKILEGTTPEIHSLAEARTLSLTATLSRDGTDYARCTLQSDNHVSSRLIAGTRLLVFEFKVDQRLVDGRFRSKKGSCDIDLTTTGMQLGVPAVQRGDSIRVNEPSAGDFVQGQF